MIATRRAERKEREGSEERDVNATRAKYHFEWSVRDTIRV